MSVRDVLAYPLRGEVPYRTLATGALLSALGVLVLPGILVAGYYGRVLAGSADGDRRPPEFVRWRALFVQGLKTWTVVTGYLVFALLLLLLLGVATIALGGLGIGAGAVGLLALAVAGLILVGVLFGPAWFFLPAALTHVARADDVAVAFDIRAIGRIAIRREYLTAWLPGMVLLLAGSIAYGVLQGSGSLSAWLIGGAVGAVYGGSLASPAFDPGLLGHALGAAINFYCQVVAFHLFGRGYGAAAGVIGEASADEEVASDEAAAPADEPQYTGWGAEAREWRERRREERERA